jgi:hypothetical protein
MRAAPLVRIQLVVVLMVSFLLQSHARAWPSYTVIAQSGQQPPGLEGLTFGGFWSADINASGRPTRPASFASSCGRAIRSRLPRVTGAPSEQLVWARPTSDGN